MRTGGGGECILSSFMYMQGRRTCAWAKIHLPQRESVLACAAVFVVYYYIEILDEVRNMVQLPSENSILARTVRRAADEGRLSHAVILTGRGDLTAAARFIAAAHVCQEADRPCLHCRHCRKVLEGVHPDVLTVQDTEHRELTVEAVRALRKDVYIRPNEAERKVYILRDCRQLNERDQNVLLKIVEEGPPYAAFLFCADSPAALLETVRSRCVTLRYDEGSELPMDARASELCRAFSTGRLLPVTSLLVGWDAGKPALRREELRTLLRDAWRTAAEALLLRQGKPAPEPTCADEARLLADRLTKRQLAQLADALRRYAAECDYNVGVGQVLGALAVKWEEFL